MRRIEVMIVDDRADIRRGLSDVLAIVEDLVVCGEAADVAEAEAVALDTRPDVVVVDLRLGDDSGVDASRSIRSSRPETQVLMLTAAPEEEARLASEEAGALGYLPKQGRGAEIVAAIRDVAEGHPVPPPD